MMERRGKMDGKESKDGWKEEEEGRWKERREGRWTESGRKGKVEGRRVESERDIC